MKASQNAAFNEKAYHVRRHEKLVEKSRRFWESF